MTKYRAVKTEVDGIVFDSKAEARRYGELKLLEKAGYIRQLSLQPKFACIVNTRHVCTYKADFRYLESGRRVVEDVKGYRTRDFIIKKKLVEALFPGIVIREVKA